MECNWVWLWFCFGFGSESGFGRQHAAQLLNIQMAAIILCLLRRACDTPARTRAAYQIMKLPYFYYQKLQCALLQLGPMLKETKRCKAKGKTLIARSRRSPSEADFSSGLKGQQQLCSRSAHRCVWVCVGVWVCRCVLNSRDPSPNKQPIPPQHTLLSCRRVVAPVKRLLGRSVLIHMKVH